MIYLIYGSDINKVQEKTRSLVDSLVSKKPDANLVKMNDDNFDETILEESIKGRGLFESKYIVVLDRTFSDPDRKDLVLEKIKDLKESENIFILSENHLDKKTLTKLEKNSEKVQELNESINQKSNKAKKHDEEKRKTFALTDAIGRRDKKEAWIKLQDALKRGVLIEEVHGMTFWIFKSMILAGEYNSASEAGLNPFVYRKSRTFSKNYSILELKNLSSKLVEIYHKSRMGDLELTLATEKFILEI